MVVHLNLLAIAQQPEYGCEADEINCAQLEESDDRYPSLAVKEFRQEQLAPQQAARTLPRPTVATGRHTPLVLPITN